MSAPGTRPALMVAARRLRVSPAVAASGLAGRALAVRIVQPAIDHGEKWDEGVRDRIFRTLLDLSSQPPEAGKCRSRT
jgi:apolipoprotein N-acyltransferase